MKKFNLNISNKRVITGICISMVCLILIAAGILIFNKYSSDSDIGMISNGIQTSRVEWYKNISLNNLMENKRYSIFLPTEGYELSWANWAPKSEILLLHYQDRMYNAFEADIRFRCNPDQLKTVDVNDVSRYDITKSKLPINSEVSICTDIACPLFNASELTPNVIKKRRQTSIDDFSKMEKISYCFAVKEGNKRIDISAESGIGDLTANDVYTFVRSIPAVKNHKE